jgi:hypothetical protein
LKFGRKGIVFVTTLVLLIAAYFLTKQVSSAFLESLGVSLPLPLFTLVIALIDGFNPCNLFVLTLLLSLILTHSTSRSRMYAVGITFIITVYIFYFLFMAAWLNIFKYIGFIDPLRIGIALLAIIAGLINCKEYFFYRKWITLMVQPKQVGPLKQRTKSLANKIQKGSVPTLIGASFLLAVFASLVELPCTAGFPIIYTGVLTSVTLSHSLMYYAYLLLYNVFYVLPLFVVIGIIGFTFKGEPIKSETMALIKFIGGVIMLLLGIILLTNPALVGILVG